MEDKIAEIRARFETDLATLPTDQYHPIDIERVRKEDWQIRRYLIDADDNSNEAYRNLCKTLQWKQSIGVHNHSEEFFPFEFYELYNIEKYGFDRDGHLIFSESYKNQRYYSEMHDTFRLLVAVSLEHMDRLAGERGMCYLAECSGMAIHTFDVGLARFRVDVLNRHYPQLAKRIILNNTPMLVKPVIKVVVSFLKQSFKDAVVYTSTNQLTDYIESRYLHTDQNGHRVERFYPTKALPMRKCYSRFNLNNDFVEYFYRYNQL